MAVLLSTACPNEVVNVTASIKPGWKYDIQTPGFPNHYPANATCTWRVTLPDFLSSSYRIMLIVDTYEIEFCPGCACDYLTYGDKEKDLQNGYRRRCNFYSKNYIAFLKLTSVGSLVTSGSGDKELWLRFHSDHSAEFKGLKGKLRVIYRDRDCNNYLNDTSGSIVSPKYPSQYLKSQTITWCLMVPHGFRVKLKFTTFELENTVNKDNDCLNDYVEVRDGVYRGYGELLGRFCGNTIPDEIYSLSNQMWVVFVSDNNATTTYKGFKADFVNGEKKAM
ncbi:hypothetical protein QZH41_008042 [Actinostola sp. cb2023]|nr:hypothetical protein QZH41_008042 [Actinostola sp. cb2023]